MSQLEAALAEKTRRHHEAMTAAEQHKAALDRMSIRLQTEVESRVSTSHVHAVISQSQTPSSSQVRLERDLRVAGSPAAKSRASVDVSDSSNNESTGHHQLEIDAVAAQSLVKTQVSSALGIGISLAT
eukprot:SAG31_NODE_11077_length_1068_cov_6.365325_2_plen_128_part_00